MIDKQYKIDKYMMDIAVLTAKQSYCKKLQVGAVIAKDNRPIITGYNGTISGLDNCCETHSSGMYCSRCESKDLDSFKEGVCSVCNQKGYIEEYNKVITNEFVVHAEQNAILFAAKNGISINDCTLYITHSPCENCSKLIASSGINRVVINEFYKTNSGEKFLTECGIDLTFNYLNK